MIDQYSFVEKVLKLDRIAPLVAELTVLTSGLSKIHTFLIPHLALQ